jgi:hypothetical protein
MSVRLDCTSVDTAVASLAGLFGMTPIDVRRRCEQLEVDWHHARIPPEDQILQMFGYNDDNATPRPSAIRWFHATRLPEDAKFDEGILPTRAALERLWQFLDSIGPGLIGAQKWLEFKTTFPRSNTVFAQQFRNKRDAAGWEGPFAFLVRDAALSGSRGGGDHRDFTDAPESLEDICGDFEIRFGASLANAYRAVTRRCLVSFTQPGSRQGGVRAATSYVYYAIHGLEQARWCNTCFSGEGERIPAERIDEIEWLGAEPDDDDEAGA